MRKELIEQGFESLEALLEVQKQISKVSAPHADELDRLIEDLRTVLKEALFATSWSEWKQRPQQEPADRTMEREIQTLSEALKNPMRRDGIDVTGTLDQILSDYARRSR